MYGFEEKHLTLKDQTAQLSESLMMSFHSSKCTSATTGDPGTDLLSLLWAFHRNGFILA